ncbi:MAG TPA: prepilin-type N-terminal cleavage/methylation domain-containing protein [Candidatus Acidoferrales bacterium]|nr:prepilin-type N-terminal cleavage/methylation domain-containing protein [Candidatus Acidoferrales bacterium]
MMLDFKERRRRTQRQRLAVGFSLIELLVVVAVILIIAAIAIPNFMRARMAANEAAAASSVRAITTAEVSYSTTYGVGYAPLTNLGGAAPCTPSAATACLIDQLLAAGTKSGYNISTPVPAAVGTLVAPNISFVVVAVPVAVGVSGQRSFCTDESGVIHFDPAGGAVATEAACEALSPL